MNIIARPRDTGKTRELLEAAAATNSIVVTDKPRSLTTKAQAYGLHDLTILSYEDLINGDYYCGQSVMVWNASKFMSWFLDKYCGLNLQGYTVTLGEENN